MYDLVEQLATLPVFSEVPGPLLGKLLAEREIAMGLPGDTVDLRPVDYFILLEGSVQVVAGDAGQRTVALSVPAASSQPAWLYSLPADSALTVITPARYIVLNGELIDAALSERRETAEQTGIATDVRARMRWLRLARPFDRLTMEQLLQCAGKMSALDVEAGTEIVEQGEVGDFFYVIEVGEAEVVRANPLSGEDPITLATLGPGASFGEEALIEDGYRNATVRASAPTRLLRLSRTDFDTLIRDRLLAEVDASEAQRLIRVEGARLIDCRNAYEHGIKRIPGARHVPLEDIRAAAATLDHDQQYLVYCRSGRLSRSAAFLLSELGLKASTIKGGIAAWPHETESDDDPAVALEPPPYKG